MCNRLEICRSGTYRALRGCESILEDNSTDRKPAILGRWSAVGVNPAVYYYRRVACTRCTSSRNDEFSLSFFRHVHRDVMSHRPLLVARAQALDTQCCAIRSGAERTTSIASRYITSKGRSIVMHICSSRESSLHRRKRKKLISDVKNITGY